MRNPFSGQMKPGTSKFYVNDVGQDNYEEVDVIQSRGNYGWPNAEGPSTNPAYVNPLYAYSHAGFSSAAITGGAFYTANQFPAAYQGSYFFSDKLALRAFHWAKGRFGLRDEVATRLFALLRRR